MESGRAGDWRFSMSRIKAGDTVLHHDSGEKWSVAWADEKELIAAGWPETLARVDGCELLESCTDEQSVAMLEQAVKSSGMKGPRAFQSLVDLGHPRYVGERIKSLEAL